MIIFAESFDVTELVPGSICSRGIMRRTLDHIHPSGTNKSRYLPSPSYVPDTGTGGKISLT